MVSRCLRNGRVFASCGASLSTGANGTGDRRSRNCGLCQWLLLFWLLASGSSLSGQEEMLNQAIEAYSKAIELKERDRRLEQFARSEQLFMQVIEQRESRGQEPSADLLTNLGNASLQAGHVGQAIVAFRRALLAQPNHTRATQNLRFARSTLPDWAQKSSTSDLSDTLFFWRKILSIQWITGVAAVCFLAGALLVALSIASKSSMGRNLALLPLAIWLVLMLSLLLQRGQNEPEAVVIADGAYVFSADSENSPPRLSEPLPDGTELSVLQTRDRWSEVRISGRTGWVRSSALCQVVHYH